MSGPNSLNTMVPPACAVTPLRVAVSLIVASSGSFAVSSASVVIVGVVFSTVEVSLSSPHLPATASLLVSPL